MSNEHPNIVVFFWDNFGWGSWAATAVRCCVVRLRRGLTGMPAKGCGCSISTWRLRAHRSAFQCYAQALDKFRLTSVEHVSHRLIRFPPKQPVPEGLATNLVTSRDASA